MMPLPLELIYVPSSIYIDLMLWKGKFNSNWTKALIIGGGAFVILCHFSMVLCRFNDFTHFK